VRFGSLFSGIGGLDLGLEMAGMECSWMVEVDNFGSQILKHHWPKAEMYGDIYTIDGKELESVDLICGGFPCQPVSHTGKRAGTADERWLWGEFARIIRQVKPRWVVAENVTGLLSTNSGRAFAEVLRDLAESGYDAVWDVFPAGGQGGVGAPHRRKRIFIIAKLANSKRIRQQGSRTSRKWSSSETYGERQTDNAFTVGIDNQWSVEPNVGRVAYGVPNRMDRLKALGNAVVPQVAKQIGEMIMEIESV
jgi:DNA (cytosine-5)-methyltransferase 1